MQFARGKPLNDGSRYITELSNTEARERLLMSSSYFDMELPQYFNFEPILNAAVDQASKLSVQDILSWKPDQHEALNYTLMSNKDGQIAWRPFELINPLIYAKCVELVTTEENWKFLVDRFSSFDGGCIECCSLPVIAPERKESKQDQILNWWKRVEQRSLELSLEYSHCKLTDVSNCYPSIYSHAIGWAIHGRPFLKIKKNRFDDSLLGNQLDKLIRSSREGQTNGIPQASMLSHLLAELVLGYCDVAINERAAEISGVKILRYRDDYRIFGSSDSDCGTVLKIISEELIKFGMRLGSAKTSDENNLVVGAVKKEKVQALKLQLNQRTLQKQLLMIHDYCVGQPGAGALKFLLSEFIKSLEAKDAALVLERENPTVLVAILMDIGSTSPNVFPAVATASSMIISHLSKEERERVFSLILKKTSRIPNNGYLEIWLQRKGFQMADGLQDARHGLISRRAIVLSNVIKNTVQIGQRLRQKLNVQCRIAPSPSSAGSSGQGSAGGSLAPRGFAPRATRCNRDQWSPRLGSLPLL